MFLIFIFIFNVNQLFSLSPSTHLNQEVLYSSFFYSQEKKPLNESHTQEYQEKWNQAFDFFYCSDSNIDLQLQELKNSFVLTSDTQSIRSSFSDKKLTPIVLLFEHILKSSPSEREFLFEPFIQGLSLLLSLESTPLIISLFSESLLLLNQPIHQTYLFVLNLPLSVDIKSKILNPLRSTANLEDIPSYLLSEDEVLINKGRHSFITEDKHPHNNPPSVYKYTSMNPERQKDLKEIWSILQNSNVKIPHLHNMTSIQNNQILRIEMEKIAGNSLFDAIEFGHLSFNDILNYLESACEFIEFCSSHNIITLDLYTKNIIMTDDQQFAFIDFDHYILLNNLNDDDKKDILNINFYNAICLFIGRCLNSSHQIPSPAISFLFQVSNQLSTQLHSLEPFTLQNVLDIRNYVGQQRELFSQDPSFYLNVSSQHTDSQQEINNAFDKPDSLFNLIPLKYEKKVNEWLQGDINSLDIEEWLEDWNDLLEEDYSYIQTQDDYRKFISQVINSFSLAIRCLSLDLSNPPYKLFQPFIKILQQIQEQMIVQHNSWMSDFLYEPELENSWNDIIKQMTLSLSLLNSSLSTHTLFGLAYLERPPLSPSLKVEFKQEILDQITTLQSYFTADLPLIEIIISRTNNHPQKTISLASNDYNSTLNKTTLYIDERIYHAIRSLRLSKKEQQQVLSLLLENELRQTLIKKEAFEKGTPLSNKKDSNGISDLDRLELISWFQTLLVSEQEFDHRRFLYQQLLQLITCKNEQDYILFQQLFAFLELSGQQIITEQMIQSSLPFSQITNLRDAYLQFESFLSIKALNQTDQDIIKKKSKAQDIMASISILSAA